MSIRFILAVTLLLDFSGAAFGADLSTEELNRLVEKVRPFAKVESQSFHSFHWVSREGVGNETLDYGINTQGKIDESDPKIANHLHDWSAYYFEDFKRGLYLGLAPWTWAEYGGEFPLLYRFRIKSGIRYLGFLDKREAFAYAIDSESLALMAQAGCIKESGYPARWSHFFLGGENGGLSPNVSEKCRPIATYILRSLQVDAIYYRHERSNWNGYEHEKVIPAFAIILLNAKQVAQDGTALFYFEPGMQPSQELCEIHELANQRSRWDWNPSECPPTDVERYKANFYKSISP